MRIGLYGADRKLDVGKMNGEHFAVMAGAGLDGAMIAEADGALKDRLGRLSYVLTGAKALSDLGATETTVELDGETWFEGEATLRAARQRGRARSAASSSSRTRSPTTVRSTSAWSPPTDSRRGRARSRGRPRGTSDRSPFVQMSTGHDFKIRFATPLPYELDGGDRDEAKTLKVKVKPAAITVKVAPDGAKADR